MDNEYILVEVFAESHKIKHTRQIAGEELPLTPITPIGIKEQKNNNKN